MICGVDEAGRGPLAGPVVAAAVILCDGGIEGLDDSKKLSAARRAALVPLIRERCAVGVGIADVAEIDALNILRATMLAMTRAVEALGAEIEEALIDGDKTPGRWCDQWRWPARAIIGGDGKEAAISAASIIAKEHRDAMMREAEEAHPGYGFASHKGYGTKAHMEALKRLGPCPLHRQSFGPIAQMEML
ncbi:ribonuclease HII [Sphingomicrobium flavum]|uniref:ribonuclease HII n=1 Tax=Sphingomicrobium flavum TaxID=1229164 RepID=UPI0021AD8AA7|nr:ribonuclease HII [Sphingomicrobium flavum]